MPKVKIDAHGITIELDATEASIGELGKQAIDLYRQTAATERKPASTIGFGGQHIEKRWTRDHHHERYHGDFREVTA